MNKRSFFPSESFPSVRAGLLAGVAIASLAFSSVGAGAQVTGSSQTTTDPNGQQHESVTLNATPNKKNDKVVQTKDTKKELRKEKKLVPASTADAKLPDKQLYDKAVDATKHGHFDVARLDLQTLLNTYPDSQFQMRAKLAIADSWYKEGGTAALTQAESEYKDFITFFPNAPEAAEAQMRVGDIYFRQMDKPDRDYAKATHAEEEYRLMLQQFPESTLVPQAKQRLREVQEVMATREADIAAYYATHNNWPATIARYQTVVDTYPQYSHMDDVLVGLGDAYEAEARYVRTMKLPEAGKARLERIYDGDAAAAYTKVIIEHSAAPHVEDARDRLAAMNLPIPTPTPEQVAASVALENSRRQYRLQDRVGLMFMHKADVVLAARDGEPPLTDAPAVLAPNITKGIIADFKDAMNPNVDKPTATVANPAAAANANAAPQPSAEPATAAPTPPAAPLQFQEVPTADANAPAASVMSAPGNATAMPAPAGNSMGVEILTPGASSGTAAKPDDANGGLTAVGPPDATPLPAAEKPATTPDVVNDVQSHPQPAAQAGNANGKKKSNPAFDKNEESSSKHKKKKGVAKLNPF